MYKTKRTILGTQYVVCNGLDMADEFLKLSKEDEHAGIVLYEQGLYNQSAYFYIQAMEKYIKGVICKRVDINNDFYSSKFREIGHSLDSSIEFFILILTGNNELLKNHLEKQIKENIFCNIKFSGLYNAIRYPFYKNNIYRITKLSKEDCYKLYKIHCLLKKYIDELQLKV